MGHAVYFNYSALLESFTVEYYVKMVVMRQAVAELVFASASKRFFVRNNSYGIVFRIQVYFRENSNLFSYEKSCRLSRFETKPQGNSELAYTRHISQLPLHFVFRSLR